MTSPTHLPPRGIFVPTQLIFHPDLPATVLVTWIQLRGLAWDGWVTPPLTLSEIAAQLGIHPARLNRHLAQLQELSALSCHTIDNGNMTITFPDEPAFLPGKREDVRKPSHACISSPMDEPAPTINSYIPARILGYLSYEEDEEDFLYPVKDRIEHARDLSTLTICVPAESQK
jgi:hypothetical protein